MQTAYLNRPDSAISPASVTPGDDSALMRFGIMIGNARVLLPKGVSAEYISEPEIFAVPRAPRSLVGLIQLRGAPVAVFASGLNYSASSLPARGVARTGILVLGNQGQHGALLVAQPPFSVHLPNVAEKLTSTPASAHDAAGLYPWLVRAIRFSVTDLSGNRWWELDMAALMKGLTESGSLLASENEQQSSAVTGLGLPKSTFHSLN
jgi:hypothetical protein